MGGSCATSGDLFTFATADPCSTDITQVTQRLTGECLDGG
jgi:hypothetical protein